MRKADLSDSIDALKKIREVSDKLDYNTSVLINQNVIKILPLLEKEYNKLDKDKVEVNSPKITIITSIEAEEVGKSIQEYMNTYMEQLIEQELKIIDFDYRMLPDKTRYGIVKYTN